MGTIMDASNPFSLDSPAVRPDNRLKVTQFSPNVAQKTATADFTIKGPKSHQISGLLLKENLSPRIFKIVQSGHTTGRRRIFSPQESFFTKDPKFVSMMINSNQNCSTILPKIQSMDHCIF